MELEPLLAAARQEAEHVVVFTDRPVTGAHSVLFGSEPSNVGIVDLTATDEEVFVRLVNHGMPRRATVRLEWGSRKVEETIDLPAERTWFRKDDFSKAPELRVEIGDADPFPMDNAVRATRLGPSRIQVAVSGDMPLLRRALGAVSGVVLRGNAKDVLLSVGVDEPPPKAPFSVWLHSPEGREAEARFRVR